MEKIHSHEEKVAFYKEKFKKEHPQAMDILRLGGVHPDHQEPTPNPYIEGEIDNENFSNIGEHCIDVGICANQIANVLEKAGHIDQVENSTIVDRALIHDANKKFEIMRRKAQKSGQPIEVYSRSAYETMYGLLEKAGHSESELEYVKAAGKETGHGSLSDFIKLDSNGDILLRQDKTLAEMIVHIADDMVASPLKDPKTGELITKNSSTKFVTVAERMDLGKFSERYPFLYVEGIAFDENGNAIEVKTEESAQNKKLQEFHTYAYWQIEVTKLICAKLKDLIDPNNEQDPDKFIKNIMNA